MAMQERDHPTIGRATLGCEAIRSTEPQRLSPTDAALNELEMTTDQLARRVVELATERLMPVLRPDAQTPNKPPGQDADRNGLCPTVMRIDNISARLRMLTQEVTVAMDRLEI